MSSLVDETAAALPSSYYRWRDENSPLIVEIKIDLVPRILAELKAAEEMGLEGGGVLAGCFPKSIGPPLLRIEEFESVGRRGGDGLPYILTADQRQRFTAARKKSGTRELYPVGYFRSHLRTGAFELSVSDRDLMSAEFRNSLHVALLVAKDQSAADDPETSRHLATYFVSVSGVIQNRVDPVTFPFEAEDLAEFAHRQPRPPVDSQPVPAHNDRLTSAGSQAGGAHASRVEQSIAARAAGPKRRSSRFAWAGVGLLALLTLTFVIWGWQHSGSSLPWSSPGLDLSVATQESGTAGNQSLYVTWNHGSPLLAHATKGVLTVSDRTTHQTIQEFELAPSDLSTGSVKVDMAPKAVEISMVLLMADASRVTQLAGPKP